MKEAIAFAPGHLTGFFQICTQAEDPLLKGARGSGVSIQQGVKTKVSIEPSIETSYTISINGRMTNEAFVSENVLSRMLSFLEQPYTIQVEHMVEVPLGAGFGSSGAGALTLALAFNEALELGMSEIKAAQIAHIAEIECGTGLGSVFAAMSGGFGVLVEPEPGAPGIGKAIKYNRSDELSVAYLHFGPIATKKALANKKIIKRINELGESYVNRIERELNPKLFMKLSRKFSDYVGIMTPRLKAVLEKADQANVLLTMAMFGEVLFTLIEHEEAGRIIEIFRETAPGYAVNLVPVEEKGAHLILK
jgi:pantoate kinase